MWYWIRLPSSNPNSWFSDVACISQTITTCVSTIIIIIITVTSSAGSCCTCTAYSGGTINSWCTSTPSHSCTRNGIALLYYFVQMFPLEEVLRIDRVTAWKLVQNLTFSQWWIFRLKLFSHTLLLTIPSGQYRAICPLCLQGFLWPFVVLCHSSVWRGLTLRTLTLEMETAFPMKCWYPPIKLRGVTIKKASVWMEVNVWKPLSYPCLLRILTSRYCMVIVVAYFSGILEILLLEHPEYSIT